MTISETIQPLYTVYYYTDFLYRVVKFKRRTDGIRLSDPDKPDEPPMEKFMQSYCRARSMVLQYILCNQWDYFITITVSDKNFDRYDLEPIAKSLKQWFLDYNKKYGCKIDFVLVPERHEDGAWHFHGVIRGIRPSHLCEFVYNSHTPKLKELHDKGYLNFPLLQRKVGFCSLGAVKSPVGVGFYVAKYVTKQNARSGFYEHLYYVSRGLKTARPVADCYTYDHTLESALEFENDFCSCGWVRDADFTFPMQDQFEYRLLDHLVPIPEAQLAGEDLEQCFVQLSLADWLEMEGKT